MIRIRLEGSRDELTKSRDKLTKNFSILSESPMYMADTTLSNYVMILDCSLDVLSNNNPNNALKSQSSQNQMLERSNPEVHNKALRFFDFDDIDGD